MLADYYVSYQTYERPGGGTIDVRRDIRTSVVFINETAHRLEDAEWVLRVDQIPQLLAEAEAVLEDDRYANEQQEARLAEHAQRTLDSLTYQLWSGAHAVAQAAWGRVQQAAAALLEHADQLAEIGELAEQALSEDPEVREAAVDKLHELVKDPGTEDELRDAIEEFIGALEEYNKWSLYDFFFLFGYLPCDQTAADWCKAGNSPECWECPPHDICECDLFERTNPWEPWSPEGSDGGDGGGDDDGGGAGGGQGAAGAPGPVMPPDQGEPAPHPSPQPAAAAMPDGTAPTPTSEPAAGPGPAPGVGPEVAINGKKGRFAYAMASGADPQSLTPSGTVPTVSEETVTLPTQAVPSRSTVTEQTPTTQPPGTSSTTSEVVPCATCEDALAASAGMSTERAIWCLAHAVGRILAQRRQRLSDHINLNRKDREAVLEALRRFCRDVARPTGRPPGPLQEPGGSGDKEKTPDGSTTPSTIPTPSTPTTPGTTSPPSESDCIEALRRARLLCDDDPAIQDLLLPIAERAPAPAGAGGGNIVSGTVTNLLHGRKHASPGEEQRVVNNELYRAVAGWCDRYRRSRVTTTDTKKPEGSEAPADGRRTVATWRDCDRLVIDFAGKGPFHGGLQVLERFVLETRSSPSMSSNTSALRTRTRCSRS